MAVDPVISSLEKQLPTTASGGALNNVPSLLAAAGHDTNVHPTYSIATHHFNAAFEVPFPFDYSMEVSAEPSELWEYLQSVANQDDLILPFPGLESGIMTPRNLFEVGPTIDMKFDDIDFAFLANYDKNNPFAITPDASGTVTSQSTLQSVESLQKASTWRFRPRPNDSINSNLSLTSTETDKSFDNNRSITSELLTHNMRGKILGLILSLNPDMSGSFSFPSTDLLNSLLQYFLATTPDTAA